MRLFVKRVFIMDDCEELLPQWLRFVRGVVDSDDLPLNVSRELLQDSAVVRAIRKHVVKKMLDLLEKLAKDKPEDYRTFWKTFGTVLKEGLAVDDGAPREAGRAGALRELPRGGAHLAGGLRVAHEGGPGGHLLRLRRVAEGGGGLAPPGGAEASAATRCST